MVNETSDEQAGLAHVATASFLASRVVPTGGFAVALAAGVALARSAQRDGLRAGYGASLAATLQAIAVMGPSRLGVPLTQALSAPLVGRIRTFAAQFAACATIRAIDQIAATAFYIWIIAGGVDAYAATYDALVGAIPGLPAGPSGAIAVTAIALVCWTIFASGVQVVVYRAALRAWPAATDASPVAGGRAPDIRAPARDAPAARRFDPRAVVVAAAIAFMVLIATTAWPVLVVVSAWLAIAWSTSGADRAPVRAGLALAALLAAGALIFGLLGGVGLDLTLQRTIRAGLLVLVATWLRAAAGEDGLREVARRTLARLRRVPATTEAAGIFACLGADGGLSASGRALVEDLRHVPRRPAPVAATVLRWVAREAERFAPPPPAAPGVLRASVRDRALVAGVVAGIALASGATVAFA